MVRIRPMLPTPRRALNGMLIAMASSAVADTVCAQVCFETPGSTSAGSYPASLVAADLDGDGDVDVAMADVNASSVHVLLNDGQGNFANQGPNAVNGNPWSVTSADLDADGDVDLAVANRYTSTLSVLLNQGNGTFASHVQYAVAGPPTCVKSADLDGDGFVDLVATGDATSNASVLLNLGNGTFAPSVQYTVGGSPVAFGLADFDGDGDADIAAALPYSHTLSILLNQGNGTFVPFAQYTVPAFARAMAIGDLDSDGDLDVVVAAAYESPLPTVYGGVSVFLNLGNGTFAPATFYYPSGAPNCVTIADLDGDGLRDIAVSSNYAAVLTVWRNQGNGAFGLPLSVGGGNFLQAVTHADLDADGDEDLVATSSQPSGLRVLRNCKLSGVAVCAGDGSGTPCPCGNFSPPGSLTGCLNSSGLAGTLRATGSATLANDQLVLVGTGLPNSAALYFQGTTAVNAGSGAVFGDGLRCAGGQTRRLGTEMASSNGSQYPGLGDEPVSMRGAVVTPGQRFYQAWYRDAASFCTTSTFNLTNALAVTWAP